MNVDKPLGLFGEHVINHLEATLTERDEFYVVQTPTSPNYYFGNLLALKIPLASYTPQQWQTRFNEVFAEIDGVEHITLTFIRQPGDEDAMAAFAALNFLIEETHVLAMKRATFSPPVSQNTNLVYRPLQSESDWQQWTELSVANNDQPHDENDYRRYLASRSLNYQRLEAEGLGQYLGAFHNDTLVGYAGLYHFNGLARFQNVHVVSHYQNQKIATTLLSHLIDQTSDTVTDLVIFADEHYHATRLYQNLGFRIAEREGSVCWWPDRDR